MSTPPIRTADEMVFEPPTIGIPRERYPSRARVGPRRGIRPARWESTIHLSMDQLKRGNQLAMGRKMVKALRILVVVAGAATATYFLDPDRGRSRRARSRDQLEARLRRMRRQAERRRRYQEGVTEGRQHGAQPAHPPADDRALADRVRSELGPKLPDTVLLNVVDGAVELRGQLPDQDSIDELMASVRGVAGVSQVVSLLHLPGTPAPNKEQALREAAEATSRSTRVNTVVP
jgi:hypothetical protein